MTRTEDEQPPWHGQRRAGGAAETVPEQRRNLRSHHLRGSPAMGPRRANCGVSVRRLIGSLGLALSAALLVLAIPQGAGAAQLPVVHYWGHSTGSFSVPKMAKYEAGGDIIQVATANSAWYVLKSNGGVEAWGNNEYGELGNGSTKSTLTPVNVRFPRHVKIAFLANTGPQSSMLAVDTTGHAWGWGYDKHGELCTGNTSKQLVPFVIPVPASVTAIAGAGDHILIEDGGTLYGCGGNAYGDLGIGNTTPSTKPVVISLPGVPSHLYASWRNSGALIDGTLYSWGYNALGEVGNGSTNDADRPVAISLPAPVTSAAWGGGLRRDGHVLALAGGTMYAWGSDLHSQLGDGATSFSVTSPEKVTTPVPYVLVEAAGSTSFGLDASGNLYGWGDDTLAQLGHGRGGAVSQPAIIATGIAKVSATANVVDDEASAG